MAVMTATVVLVGALCLVDLLLTFGVIRRLREHTQRLSNPAGMNRKGAIGPGEEVGEFVVETVDGERLSQDMLTREMLVGFFSPTCEPCREKLPEFVEFARTMPGGRDRVVAAVVGDAEQADGMVTELGPVARVVRQKDNEDTLGAAFQVMAFPTVLLVAPDERGRPVVTADRVELDRPAVLSR